MPRSARVNTAVRLEPETHEKLLKAAEERDLSVNWLINKACSEFLDRLLPPDEIQWTRDV